MLTPLLAVILAAPPVPAGFALLELFTSEGCSSCPPADDLLATLGKQPGVLAVAFHVDYWDALGWPDPFASGQATARQRAYGLRFGSNRIYTPQLVVNGRRELVGSEADEAALAVAAALATPATIALSLEGEPAKGEARWRLVGVTPGQVLNLALVEGGLSVAVPRGENGGRTLRHEHVVRAFRSVPATEAGQVTLPVPGDARKENLRMIAYLQDPATFAILAAARR